MQIDCWQIQGASFHFGKHGLGLEATSTHLPSDSLFAAMINVLARSKGGAAIRALVEPMSLGSVPFVISSGFPYAGSVRFFPTPLHSPSASNDSLVNYKKLKKVKFLSENLFRQMINGASLSSLYPNALLLKDGAVLVSQAEAQNIPEVILNGKLEIWKSEKRPRVTIDRRSSKSTIYHSGQVVFSPNSGLWFGVRWVDKSYSPIFENALSLLEDAGIGGERSAGQGACKILPFGTMDLPDRGKGPWVTMSRYLPQKDEMGSLSFAAATYTVDAIGGWIDSPEGMNYRRRQVNLILEGSVLGPLLISRTVPGQIADVSPSYKNNPNPLSHPVYRCGFAFDVGMKGVAG